MKLKFTLLLFFAFAILTTSARIQSVEFRALCDGKSTTYTKKNRIDLDYDLMHINVFLSYQDDLLGNMHVSISKFFFNPNNNTTIAHLPSDCPFDDTFEIRGVDVYMWLERSLYITPEKILTETKKRHIDKATKKAVGNKIDCDYEVWKIHPDDQAKVRNFINSISNKATAANQKIARDNTSSIIKKAQQLGMTAGATSKTSTPAKTSASNPSAKSSATISATITKASAQKGLVVNGQPSIQVDASCVIRNAKGKKFQLKLYFLTPEQGSIINDGDAVDKKGNKYFTSRLITIPNDNYTLPWWWKVYLKRLDIPHGKSQIEALMLLEDENGRRYSAVQSLKINLNSKSVDTYTR